MAVIRAILLALALPGLAACDRQDAAVAVDEAAATSAAVLPAVAEAEAFVLRAEHELAQIGDVAGRAAWVNATHITADTDWLAARASAQRNALQVRLAREAARFDQVRGMTAQTRRKLELLKQSIELPAPGAEGAAQELADIATRLKSAYAKGMGSHDGVPLPGSELESLMGTVRDPQRLSEMWQSWHAIGAPMRADYVRLVGMGNSGARELGFADLGAMWRSGYDMPPDEFARLTDALWLEVKPLYDELHCYARQRLNLVYGDAVQAASGPIRADLLGNMWAQEWHGIYDLLAPPGRGDAGYDLTRLLQDKGHDALQMVRTGERFFSSLGFDPLPQTFWERSMFTRPAGRDVRCHASAWNIDARDDLRIKMCINVTGGDFVTVHHELGHNYYQRAYKDQPRLFLGSANDGFHEAVGDMIGLSMTPEYLAGIGLLDAAQLPDASGDIGLLLNEALQKVPGLPWTLLVDKWRWGVFDGSIAPQQYNSAWHELRLRYMGVVPPVARNAADFDPGAKYHIAGNVPYTRYFLARMLQFQFYQRACEIAGWQGPLHRCSFYGNRDVGAKLNAMLALGRSQPWPDTLEVFTGTRQMSGAAMVAYFAPLMQWLKQQNQGQQCGW